MNCIKKLQEKYMILSIDTEKYLLKFSAYFFLKAMKKIGIEGYFLTY